MDRTITGHVWWARLPGWISGASLACLIVLLVFECARPIDTNDFWWHAKLGWVFATQGLDLSADPFTHTALPGPPPRAQWLFDLGLHELREAVGFGGLRVVHAALVAVSVALAFSSLRATGATIASSCCATAVFIILAWYRFIQLRPDLVSILATLTLYHLVLAQTLPSWPRVVAAAMLIGLWSQMHALFMLGPLLLVAAVAGCVLEALLAVRDSGSSVRAPWRRAARLLIGLLLALLLSRLNAEGPALQLAFVKASTTGAIFNISDDWARLATLDPRVASASVSPLVAVTANAALALFAAAALALLWHSLRRTGSQTLRRLDPVGLCVGLAASCAMLLAVRFLWLVFFPLVYLARQDLAPRRSSLARWREITLATACAALAAALPAGAWNHTATPVPDFGRDYLAVQYRTEKFYVEAVNFLAATQLSGNLFNDYPIGGFLDFWLAPRLRTFIDGRMSVPREVFHDLSAISSRAGGLPGESYLDTLERERVDVFLGVGTPPVEATGNRRPERFTTTHLEGAAGWIPVFRSIRSAVYLRTNERNRENLARVERWYRRQSIPFDRERGFDAARVAREQPTWSEKHGVVWGGFAVLLHDAESKEPSVRRPALELLAITWARLGAYGDALAIDEALAASDPRDRAAHRRLVHCLLRLGRYDDAVVRAEELVAIDPADRLSAEHLRVARWAREIAAAPNRFPPGTVIDLLPLPTLAAPSP